MLFGKLKLTSKLAVIIGAVLAVIFALLIGVTISTTSTSIQKGIAGELSALARATGTEIQDSFGVVDDTARGIQEYIGRIYAKPNGAPGDAAAMQQSTLYPGLSLTSNAYDMEQFIVETVRNAVKNNPELEGIGVMFEPNQFQSNLRHYGFYIDMSSADAPRLMPMPPTRNMPKRTPTGSPPRKTGFTFPPPIGMEICCLSPTALQLFTTVL